MKHIKESNKTYYYGKKSKNMLGKRFRRLGKSYIHTPKPQIQDVEPRKGRLGLKTIPCILGGDARIKEL